MTRKWLLASILLFVSAIPAFGTITGNDVLEHCQTAVQFAEKNGGPAGEHYDAGWCIGWVAGTLQLTQMHNDWTAFIKEKPNLLQFCVPDPGIPTIQAVRVVVKYLKEHPDELHEDGMGLTVAALRDSFPCSARR